MEQTKYLNREVPEGTFESDDDQRHKCLTHPIFGLL